MLSQPWATAGTHLNESKAIMTLYKDRVLFGFLHCVFVGGGEWYLNYFTRSSIQIIVFLICFLILRISQSWISEHWNPMGSKKTGDGSYSHSQR